MSGDWFVVLKKTPLNSQDVLDVETELKSFCRRLQKWAIPAPA
jgi:hypothetical protein